MKCSLAMLLYVPMLYRARHALVANAVSSSCAPRAWKPGQKQGPWREVMELLGKKPLVQKIQLSIFH